MACKECNGAVSNNAKACPHCGAPVPRGGAGAPIIGGIIAFGFIAMLVQCSADMAARSGAKPASKSAAECIKDLKCWSDKHAATAYGPCTRAIEAQLRFAHEWTSGVMAPRFPRIGWKDPTKGQMTFFGDELRMQNAFGAMQKAEYACVFDPASGQVLQVAVAPK